MPKARRFLKARRWVALALSALMVAIYLPAQAYAVEYGGAAGNVKQTCKQIKTQIANSDGDDLWLTEYIVTCIKTVVQDAFMQFLTGFYSALATPIKAAATLSVALFGGLLAAGMLEKTARDSMLFLLKIACVTYFVQVSTAQWVYQSGIGAMDELTDLVWTVGETGGSFRCPDTDTIWDSIDCTLDILIGIRKDVPEEGITASKNKVSPELYGISRGLMHFFFANMNSSGTGAGAFVIGALGMYTVFIFTMALIKSIHTYLASVLGIAFIVMFSPLFVPMLMFKATRSYFDKWYRIGVSFILQPVILFGYLSLMLTAIDTIMVSGNNSVLNTITGNSCPNDVPSKCLENQKVFEAKNITQFQEMTPDAPIRQKLTNKDKGTLKDAPISSTNFKITDKDKEGVSVVDRPFEGVDYQKLAQVMKTATEGEALEKLSYASIIMALTMFVFISMLNYVPVMATDLSGGVNEVPNLYEAVGSKLPGGDQLERITAGISSNVRGRIGSSNFMQQFQNLVTRR